MCVVMWISMVRVRQLTVGYGDHPLARPPHSYFMPTGVELSNMDVMPVGTGLRLNDDYIIIPVL